MPTLFETKYPNNSRVVSGVAQIYRDDVVLLCDTSSAPVTINLFDIPNGFWSTQWKLYIVDNSSNASVNNITINAGAGQLINGQASLVLNANNSAALVQIISDTNFIGNRTFIAGGGSVTSVTGLNTDNADPANPIVQISVDGVTITGSGTPADPLVSVGGGSGYDTIEEDGVALPQRTTLNFTGDFITATDDGAKTNVDVKPFIIDILNADLITEINNSTLIKGAFYRVTDAPYVIDLTLQAIETNQVSLEGKARKYVADYQKVGDYSAVVGFNAQLGLWNGALAPVAGDVVIWNQSHWLNTTGVNNSALSPNLDAANWSLLVVSETTGFIIEPMTAVYNYLNNKVLKLTDVRLNQIDFAEPKGTISFLNFPFGKNGVDNNIFKGEETAIDENFGNTPFTLFSDNTIINGFVDLSINFSFDLSGVDIYIEDNYLCLGGQIEVQASDISNATQVAFRSNVLFGGNCGVSNVLNSFSGSIIVQSNKTVGGTRLSVTNITGINTVEINNNDIRNNGSLTILAVTSTTSAIRIAGNVIIESDLELAGISGTADFENNRVETGQNFTIPAFNTNNIIGVDGLLTKDYSNFTQTLDLSDPTVYDGVAFELNLGATNQWVGRYLLQNGVGNQINKIINGTPTERPFTLIADSGAGVLAFRLGYVAIGAAVQDDIITNTNLTTKSSFTSYATLSENITLKRGGGVTGNLFVVSRENWT